MRPPAIIDGRYEIVAELGTDSASRVFAARDRVSDRSLTLELVDAEPAAAEQVRVRLLRELHVAAALRHPGAAVVSEVGEHAGLPYVTTALPSGCTLREALREAPFAVERATRLLAAITEVLAAAHALPVVHAGIDPTSIMLQRNTSGDEQPVLRFARTCARSAVDAAAYTAPEQTHERDPAAPVDIYALGCIAYELLTGAPPFVATPSELVAMHRFVAPRTLAHARGDDAVAAPLEALVAAMLAKRPANRPTAPEVLAALSRHDPVLGRRGDVARAARFAALRDAVTGEMAPLRAPPPPFTVGIVGDLPASVARALRAANVVPAPARAGVGVVLAIEVGDPELRALVTAGALVLAAVRLDGTERLVELMRLGVADTVGLPLVADEVVNKLHRLARKRPRV